MNKKSPYSRRAIWNIIPYEPGKPISEVQREYGLKDVIKLASNENPLGPSPKAVKAIQEALHEMHLYPDGGGYYLKQKISEVFDVTPANIVIGNGSAELVELITESFIGEGDEAVIGRQAFFKYRIAVQIMNGVTVWAPMPDYKHDAESMLAGITGRTRVLFIANPNNPTGTLMEKDEVEFLMNNVPERVLVVFDEAYYDFRDHDRYPDTLKYVKEGRSVVILRTFSKSYGLAALRIGYALTTEPVIQAMNAVREAFNVNSLAQVGALAALDDHEFLARGLKNNREGRDYFYRELDRIGLEYVPTEANFVLIKTTLPGRQLFLEMLKKGVVIRPVDGYGLPGHVRVSIGLPSETERFFHECEKVLKERNLLS